MSASAHDSSSKKSKKLKKYRRKFKLIRTETIDLEKAAQEAISFWHSLCHGYVIIAGAVSFLSIANLLCCTVYIFAGLILLFLLGMVYPSICAFHKLRYVDTSFGRLKGRLTNLINDIGHSSVSQSEESYQELLPLQEEASDFKPRVNSHYRVQLIIQMVFVMAYFLMILFIAYSVFCGKNPFLDLFFNWSLLFLNFFFTFFSFVHCILFQVIIRIHMEQNPHGRNPLGQVWRIRQQDRSEGARTSST